MSSRQLRADLARWEAGELTADELVRRHPGPEVGAMLALHGQLSQLVDAPTPDPAAAWAVVGAALPARAETVRARRGPRRSVVAAIVVSVLAVPAVSYAAAPDTVESVVREVRDLLPGTNGDGPFQRARQSRRRRSRFGDRVTRSRPSARC